MIELSIITINFNNKSGLKQTIDSVLAQTYSNFEYIIIDNQSTDGSVELIQQYGTKITKFICERDSGIYNAQNKGILNATGNYLLFLNSGDFLCDKDVLKNVFNVERVEDIVYGNMKINWGNNSVSNGIMPDVIDKAHMFRDTLWHPVSFIKSEVFNKYGLFNENYKLVADYDFFFKVIIKHKVTVKHLDVYITQFNVEGASSSVKNKDIEQMERKKVQLSYLTSQEIEQLEREFKNKETIFTKLKRLLKGN